MSLATNSNLNRTQATFRTVNASMAKFLSLAPEAKLLIVSNSCNINSNVFVIGSDSVAKETYLASGNNKLLTVTNSNVNFLKPVTIAGNLSGDSKGSLGTSDSRWNSIHLGGNEIHINNAVLNYQETFSSNYVITDYDISFKDKTNDEYIGIAAKSLRLQHVDEYSASITTGPTGAIITSRKPDGTLINSINLGLANTSFLQEGSNWFFTPQRVQALAASLNIQSSNYVDDTSNSVLAFYQETSNQIVTSMANTKFTIASNITGVSNQIFSNLNVLDIRTSNQITNMSNILSSNITAISSNIYRYNATLDTNMSNYVRVTSNFINSNIAQKLTIDVNRQASITSNNTIRYHNNTCNILTSNINRMVTRINSQMAVIDSNQSNIIKQMASNLQQTANKITSYITTSINITSASTSNTISNISSQLNTTITQISTAINNQITQLDTAASNNVQTTSDALTTNLTNTSNTLANRIANLTTDKIAQGRVNKFIVNNVYDGDLTTSNLTVIGNLTPAQDSVYDLGSSNQRWKDIYLSGNTIYLNNTKLSSDPVTKGLVVKNQQGQLSEVVAASIKLQDTATGQLVLLQSVGNKINVSTATPGSSGASLQKALTTDTVIEAPVNLYFTPQRVGVIAEASNISASNLISQMFTDISSRLDSLTADRILRGTSNSLIFNQTYASNLTITGTLTACNLQVIGQETLIKTATFTTDNMEILTQSYTGPALAIIQRGASNIAEFCSNNTLPPLVTISSTGLIGIGTTLPREAIDVIGNIKLSGTLNNITSNELMYLKGTSNNIQNQIDSTHLNSSNYLLNTSNTLSSNLTVTSNAVIQNLTTSSSNQSNIISSISGWMNTLYTNTSNAINSNITNIFNNSSNNTSNTFVAYSTKITNTSNTLSTRVTTWSTDTSNLISKSSNNMRIALFNMNSNISNLITTITSTGWQSIAPNLYINSNVRIGTSITNAALDVAGSIRLSNGSNINGITTTVLGYLSDTTWPIQGFIDYISLTSSNTTSNMSNILANNLSTLFDTLNSNITIQDTSTSNYINSTSNTLSSNLLTVANTINARINALNFTQWTTLKGSNIYFENAVAIGTSNIGAGNKLEIFGGDLLVVGGTIKKAVDGRAVENYQIERWKDSATYYTSTKFITYTDGKVGIALVGEPYSPLHVGADTRSSTQSMSYFTSNSTAQIVNNASYTLSDICAIFDSSILVKDTIASSSDQRIKKNIQDINDDSALQKILAIEPKTYNYKDPQRGLEKVYGFIAQQIREVIPEAVTLCKQVVPNIFCVADSYLNVVTFDQDIAAFNLSNDTKVSIINLSGQQDLYSINEVNQESRSIILDKNIEGEKVFVYGTEVNDFHALDKSYIFTLNVCATQKLSEKIDDLEKRMAYIDFLNSKQ